ncbi:MAG: hypothetical protein ACQXXH_03430 [Candidatus Bathyarchaeia archaeon]|jgi:hypothetical protein|nr:hypothetical protein [Candidatus Bathyarchaeota archaeon A05DMB-4]MDH7594791.1 hypothetical protein [Candidatus Bathyarchaeota archaeon]
MKGYKNAAEAKLASLAWKLKLIQTSAEVTRTPITTLKSLLLDAVKNETPVYIEKLEKCLVNLGRTYTEAFTTA